MTEATMKQKAITEAERQLKENKLTFDPRDGYAFDFKAITQKSGLRYGPAWRAVTRATMPEKYRVGTEGMSRTQMAALVARMRGDENLSWGMIAERMGVGAGLVYRLFEEATGLRAVGLRIGRGGRMAEKRADLYAGGAARKEKGSEIRSGVLVAEAKPTTKRTLPQRVAKAVQQ
jgi:hypothetical protein